MWGRVQLLSFLTSDDLKNINQNTTFNIFLDVMKKIESEISITRFNIKKRRVMIDRESIISLFSNNSIFI